MSPQIESILMKIKKLSNLTESRGATPAEAANAAAKVQALLFEHNLSMAAVAGVNLDKSETLDKTLYEMAEGKDGSMGWRKSLLGVVARYNFCKLIVEIEGKHRLTAVIGKKSNVEVVLYIYEHVQREIHRLAKSAQRLETHQRSIFYTSFCLGAVATITERLKAQQRTQEQTSKASTALVVQTKAQLDQAVAKFFPVLRNTRRVTAKRGDGFAAGQQAGQSIALNRGVGHSGAGQRRIS